MSFSQTTVSYETKECPKKLLQYANEKRQEGTFNDVTIKVGKQILQANRMILSCYSKFFDKMFQSKMKEQYQDTVEIKDFNGEAVKMLIDFIYDGKVNIKQDNVMKLLAAADFLQLQEIKEFCFDFLERGMIVDNSIDILNAYNLYKPVSSLVNVYHFIGENLDEIVETDQFNCLSKNELVSLIINLSVAEVTSIYEAVRHWVKYDEEQRSGDFKFLLQSINLHQLPSDYLENVVAADQLVNENNDCLKAVVSQVFKKLKEPSFKESGSKILCLGGEGGNGRKVIEVYNVSGPCNTVYPDLPLSLRDHCVANINNVVYCIGGYGNSNQTSNVYRLNLNKDILKWEEVCSMNEGRYDHAAAVFKNSIVVCGGRNRGARGGVDSAELYDIKLKKWKRISSMNRGRRYHAMVECNGCLYAIGGSPVDEAPIVERLSELDGEWEPATPMQTPRHYVAAVNCEGYIYVIGGLDAQKRASKVVEKFDPVQNKWSYVSNMINAKYGHSACVLRGRIFVVGGLNTGVDQNSIEYYDPVMDTWSIVANATHEACYHALVVV